MLRESHAQYHHMYIPENPRSQSSACKRAQGIESNETSALYERVFALSRS